MRRNKKGKRMEREERRRDKRGAKCEPSHVTKEIISSIKSVSSTLFFSLILFYPFLYII
jgi:hypothetical protein